MRYDGGGSSGGRRIQKNNYMENDWLNIKKDYTHKIKLKETLGWLKMDSSVSNSGKNLNALIEGTFGGQRLPFATDGQGRLILSPVLSYTITANNLDVRDLSSSQDSLSITASDLDIANLQGTKDSLRLQRLNFAEGNESGTIVALGQRAFLPRDISSYRSNTYFVVNNGGVGVTVSLQLAAVNSSSYYITDGSSFSLLAGGTRLFVPTRPSKFARVFASAVLLASIEVYYFGQA